MNESVDQMQEAHLVSEKDSVSRLFFKDFLLDA